MLNFLHQDLFSFPSNVFSPCHDDFILLFVEQHWTHLKVLDPDTEKFSFSNYVNLDMNCLYLMKFSTLYNLKK